METAQAPRQERDQLKNVLSPCKFTNHSLVFKSFDHAEIYVGEHA
jgi:hypothetical protein